MSRRFQEVPLLRSFRVLALLVLLTNLLAGCGGGGGGGGSTASTSITQPAPSTPIVSGPVVGDANTAPATTTPPVTSPSPSDAPTTPPPAQSEQSRLGVNLEGPSDWSTEQPFVDCFRLSRAWISQRDGLAWGQGPTLSLRSDGYPASLQPGCYAETLMLTIPGAHRPQGRYVCLYDGTGTVTFSNVGQVVSQTAGRIVVELRADSGPFLQIRATDPANPVRNIRFLKPGFESTYASDPFDPAFLQRWGGFQTYRFMDWMRTNGSTIRTWTDRPRVGDATWTEKGVPLEVIIDLCNRQGVNPWICVPHQADDEYVRSMAALFRDRLDPSLKVWVEYSNEVWNGGFPQYTYAEQQARTLGLGPADRPWEGAAMFYSRRSREIFTLFEQQMGGRQRMVRVLAWQAANAWTTENIVLPSFQAGQNADVLAIAPYMTFLPSPGGVPDSTNVATWTLDQLMTRIETQVFDEAVSWMRQNKAAADVYGLKLVAYEAGQHLVGIGGAESNDALTALFASANRSARMGALYTRYMDAWLAVGGDTMCLFSSCGEWSGYGSWGLSEYPDASTPKLEAVLRWNQEHPRP